jgi:DNA-binding transcriptional regulator LsrR (DeoR family)
MAIYDNERLVIKVCQLFYMENKSQKEISTLLNISKPQICRILSYAKENHIVEFTIHNPYAHEFEIEKQLRERYHLKESFIFDIKESKNPFEQLGEAFAPQLDQYLTDNAVIGVMSGRSVLSVANHAHRLNRENLLFVPLAGSEGSSGGDWQANAIARIFAKKTGGSYRLLNAPILVKNLETRNLLCSEPSIEDTLHKAQTANLSLLGIGDISLSSSAYLNGYFADGDIPKLMERGVVALVGTSFLNQEGEIVSEEITHRSIGISLPDMKDSLTIAIASGDNKLEAVHSALKSGFIDIFVSTLEFSQLLLNHF